MEFRQGQTTRDKYKEFYIGEIECSLETCFLEHKRRSSTSSEVSNQSILSLQAIILTLMRSTIGQRTPLVWKRSQGGYLNKVNKPTINEDGGRYKLSGVYESILRSSVPKVTTWDILTLADERRRIVWKFRGMENIFYSDQKY